MLLKKWLDFWKDNYIGNDNRERFYWLSYGAVAYVVFVAIGTVLPHNFFVPNLFRVNFESYNTLFR